MGFNAAGNFLFFVFVCFLKVIFLLKGATGLRWKVTPEILPLRGDLIWSFTQVPSLLVHIVACVVDFAPYVDKYVSILSGSPSKKPLLGWGTCLVLILLDAVVVQF